MEQRANPRFKHFQHFQHFQPRRVHPTDSDTDAVREVREVQESIGAIANGRLSQAFDGWKYRQPSERDAPLGWFWIVAQLDLEHHPWS